MPDQETDAIIASMKRDLGVELDRDLASKLEISPTAIAGWRARNRVPAKYILRFQRHKDENINKYHRDTSYDELRSAYLFALVDQVSKQLDKSGICNSQTSFVEIWRGYRLADAYEYYHEWLPTDGDKDALRKTYDTCRADLSSDDFLHWLERLGS